MTDDSKKVRKFISEKKLVLLLRSVKKYSKIALNESSDWTKVLKESVSIIANCCYISKQACVEVMDPGQEFLTIAGILLTKEDFSGCVRASVLRLFANICAQGVDFVRTVASSLEPNFLQLFVGELASEKSCEKVKLMAIQVIRSMVGRFPLLSKRIISMDGGYYLGAIIKKSGEAHDISIFNSRSARQEPLLVSICAVLHSLFAYGPKELGDQLAKSGCIPILWSVYLEKDADSSWHKLLTDVGNASSLVREALHEVDAVRTIIAKNEASMHVVRPLFCVTREAWGRVILREEGGLDLIIELLCTSISDQERAEIISALSHFSHDVIGLKFLGRSRKFVDSLVNHINQFADGKETSCCLQVESSSKKAPLIRVKESSQSRQDPMELEQYLENSGWPGGWAVSFAPSMRKSSSSRSLMLSPCVSPSVFTPPSSPGSSPPNSPCSSSSILDLLDCPGSEELPKQDTPDGDSNGDLSGSTAVADREEEEEKTLSSDSQEKEKQKMVEWELEIISRIPELMLEVEVFDAVLRSITVMRRLIPVQSYLLKSMVKDRLAVEKLLSMEFHTKILHRLWRNECSLRRPWSKCTTCNERVQLAEKVLSAFASLLATDFGVSVLRQPFSSESHLENLKSHLAAVQLLRTSGRYKPFFLYYRPFECLIDEVRSILEDEDFNAAGQKTTFDHGPSILYQIICALSTIIPAELVESSSHWNNSDYENMMNGSECVVEKSWREGDYDRLSFSDNRGRTIESVPKNRLKASCEYFRGMLENDFLEGTMGSNTLTFSEEKYQCSEEEFRQFLHFICGCRSKECFDLRDAGKVLVMIELSDRYICPSLNEMLLSPRGPAAHYMSGESISAFLEASLSIGIGAVERMRENCLCYLLLRCTEEEVVETMRSLSKKGRTTVDDFIGILQDFLQRFYAST